MGWNFGSIGGNKFSTDFRQPADNNAYQGSSVTPVDSPAPVDTPAPNWWDQVLHGDIQGLSGGNDTLPQAPNFIDQLARFDLKGLGNTLKPALGEIGTGLQQGLSKVGSIGMAKSFDQMLANSSNPQASSYGQQQQGNEQLQQNYLDAHPSNTLLSQFGEQIPQIPLWATGQNAVGMIGKGIGKLAPSLLPLAEQVGSKLPGIVKGGLLDAATYASIVAPTQNISQGGNLQSLLQAEKQTPSIFLGGVGFRGAGKVLGGSLDGLGGHVKPGEVQPQPIEATTPTIAPEQPIPAAELPKYKSPSEQRAQQTEKLNSTPLQPQQLNNAPINDVLKGTQDVSVPVLPSSTDNLTPKGNIVSAANMDHLTPASDIPKLSMDPNATTTEQVPSKYVDTKPIDINIGKNDKATSTDIRQGYVGKMNAQIVTGNQLSDTMKALAPKEQEGIQLFIDAGGDTAHLQEMAKSTDPLIDSFIPNTKITYREAYQQSLNLSPKAQEAATMAQQYYKESGQYALQTGSTKSVLDNYSNRLWKQDPGGTVKTETRTPGLNPNTSHSKERIFNTLGEGILAGKEPATLNAGDLLSIHNQEMARANVNRELATALKDKGLGNYQTAKPPEGFTAIDSMSKEHPVVLKDGTATVVHQNFVIPDGIAKGLRSITDPNYMAKVDAFRHLQAYQGLVKTVDLSFSLFHHITLAAQALYNTHGGVDFIKNWDTMSKLGSESFNKAEQWGAQHGLMTTKIDSNYDVIRQLSGNKIEGKLSEQPGMKKVEWVANKVGNLPVIKQAGQLADKNTEFLFGKIQRWLKVTDFQNKAAEFVGKNPNMQNAEVTKGLRQISSEVNNSYGGLNWKSMGVTPSVQAISRLGLLAPDWTFSSARILGQAFTKGPGGNAARSQFATGIIGAGILTEGLNYLLSGHFTDKNVAGHELEVQVQPGVYISMFRSGIGDVSKWGVNMLKQGVLGGSINTLQSKMSPLARTIVGQLSNKLPTGAPITSVKNTPGQNDLARVKALGESFLPIPMGAPNMQRYLGSGESNPLGGAFVGTGAARYSQDKTKQTADPKSAYSGNWIDGLLNKKDEASNNLINKISDQSKANISNSKLVNQGLAKALQTGGSTSDVFTKFNVPGSQQKQFLKDAANNQLTSKLSPLAQKFQGLSAANQKIFINTLSPSERASLGNVTIKK